MKWLVKFYNHITTPEGEQVISSGWCAGGITNALKNSDTCLEPLDPCADIDPIVSEPSVEQDDSNMLQIDEGLIQHLLSEDEANSQFLSFHFIKVFSIKMENLNFHSIAKLNSRNSLIHELRNLISQKCKNFAVFANCEIFLPRKFLTIK